MLPCRHLKITIKWFILQYIPAWLYRQHGRIARCRREDRGQGPGNRCAGRRSGRVFDDGKIGNDYNWFWDIRIRPAVQNSSPFKYPFLRQSSEDVLSSEDFFLENDRQNPYRHMKIDRRDLNRSEVLEYLIDTNLGVTAP